MQYLHQLHLHTVHTAQTIVADRVSIAFELTRAGFFASLIFYSIS